MNRQPQSVKRITRRGFMGGAAALAGISIVPRHVLGGRGTVPPSEKMNIGGVGVGGMQGGNDVRSVGGGENIYALCDVDANHLAKIAPKFPAAKHYRDFREMLDKEHKNLDGITVTIPDHMHATVALWAMERGIGVYCQKPLTQSVWEARLLTKAAQKYKVPTQMGNQGYSSEATRVACEIIWKGDIGDVTEVHSWCGGGFARGITKWPDVEPVPDTLNWDLWTGRAAEHTYSSKIHPINWRGFLDYGTQMIGDWGIHMLGPANWGLQLGSPTSVECTAVEGVNPVTYPSYVCKMEFPERPNKFVPAGKMPPVTLYWYEGSMVKNFKPPQGLTSQDLKGVNELFVGTKGFLGTGGRGESVRLVPESAMKGYKKPAAVIKRSPGHYQDWIRSCKGGDPACSNFTIAGPYAEWMLLGAICWRFPNEKLLWDGQNLRFTNSEKANEFVKPKFRKGWELKDITL
ncbi:MAG: Inositol 2-dehydrogenase [Planctomycetes bacterium ADurb.Bin126]|nr:MAG: Inositol 2-dehydrogenase [Planctomycetes bacterium ADurb.Bin126]HOD84280.1 Gfo/Idh/MocA family oxidoreductase [Phycisphaerae bacterium]HQL76247.1 Gfo/Idh/MocA family oxidoreductase [Phycisphaerae bacterium]